MIFSVALPLPELLPELNEELEILDEDADEPEEPEEPEEPDEPDDALEADELADELEQNVQS